MVFNQGFFAHRIQISWSSLERRPNLAPGKSDTSNWKTSFRTLDQDPFITHRHYHGCCWPANARSLGISCCGTGLVLPEYSRFSRKIVNTLRPRQDGRHFPDDILKCIFLNENARISLKKSLKYVPKVRINNIPALVQIMAWRRPGDKPLSEPMMVSLPTHICVTRPQWVKDVFD